MIDQYQRIDPSLKAIYELGTYQQSYFCGGINIYLGLITCEDKIVITSILQIYVFYWYHMYLLNTGMDITDAMIGQNNYGTAIR